MQELANRLYRTALAYLGSVQEAEDAVQDAFVCYLEKAPEELRNPAAWLTRVLVNGCKSRLRSPWRRRTVPLLESYPAADPEERGTLEAIQALPAKERAVLHLYYYEGYSIKEIAKTLGLPAATVGTRLARGRERLRQMLKEDV